MDPDKFHMPPSVPAEATLMLPPDMFGAYWAACPKGDRLPYMIPQDIWTKHCHEKLKDFSNRPSPTILRNYWYHFDDQQVKKLSVFPSWFWEEYLSKHPHGKNSDVQDLSFSTN